MKSPSLSDLIAGEIASRGLLPFARFMELALYHPGLGYYATGRMRIGRSGDFYTNVSVGPVFGRILAGQFREMWECLGRPGSFTLVEQGANDGQLAADILAALPEELPAPVQYGIVEPSSALREKQQEKLGAFGGAVHWFDSLEALPRFTGVHFSNELLDAFPFHLVQSNGSSWEELFVAAGQDGLFFSPAAASEAVSQELARLPGRPAGTLAELRPSLRPWLETLAGKMQAGFLLAVDYGFPRASLLAPHRREGTFSCYRAHRRDARPLEEPGEKDITAHVDFTTLAEYAAACGLRLEGFTDQHHFLVGASARLLQSLEGPPDSRTQKTLRALQTLLHPETMGTQFHYIAFSKGVPAAPALSGFRHARVARDVLFAE